MSEEKPSLLLDTNILISLEAQSIEESGPFAEDILELFRLCTSTGLRPFIHPIQLEDLERDVDLKRKHLRKNQIKKYNKLRHPPNPGNQILSIIPKPAKGSNDFIDYMMLTAVHGEAVDFLITEDKKIHGWAKKLGIQEKVLRASSAIEKFKGFEIMPAIELPAVRHLFGRELNKKDPIFDSLASDYGEKTFFEWLGKCRDRDCYIIEKQTTDQYEGLIILNEERRDKPKIISREKTLKICTFKTSESARGRKLGELLLRQVFDYANKNNFGAVFLETNPRQTSLVKLLESFGFHTSDEIKGQDITMIKRFSLAPHEESQLNPLDFNIRLGPYRFISEGIQWYYVPIRPEYFQRLFPDVSKSSSLFPGLESEGNTLIKAYLCNGNLNDIEPGSVLVFYLSGGGGKIVALGIVEDSLKSFDPWEIQKFSEKRTVFPPEVIKYLCQAEVLAIAFRYCPVIGSPFRLSEVLGKRRIPQSIMKVPKEEETCLRSKIESS